MAASTRPDNVVRSDPSDPIILDVAVLAEARPASTHHTCQARLEVVDEVVVEALKALSPTSLRAPARFVEDDRPHTRLHVDLPGQSCTKFGHAIRQVRLAVDPPRLRVRGQHVVIAAG